MSESQGNRIQYAIFGTGQHMVTQQAFEPLVDHDLWNKWFAQFLTRHASTSVPGHKLEPLVAKDRGRRVVQRLAGSPYVGLSPTINILDPAALAFPTRIIIIAPWFANSPCPQNQHPGSARLGFLTRIRIRGHSQQWWNKKQVSLVGNRWRTPPVSSDTGPDPWSSHPVTSR